MLMASNLTMVFYLLKNWQISNFFRSAAPKLALVLASRYNCDVKKPYVNVCAKFNYT